MRHAALASIALLAACGGNPDYYLLPPPEPQASQGASARSIAVAEIRLPTYAEAIEIAVLGPTGVVALDRNNLWADTPRRGLTRHLVAALEQRLNAQVAAEPWPGLDQPELRVEVVVDRLIGAPEQPVNFSGQYILVAPRSGQIVASDRFSVVVPPQGDDFQGLAEAHALAIEQLASDIAAAAAAVRRGAIG